MSVELYRDAQHACLMFTDLGHESDQAVQSNQFLIINNGTGAIIDPGGNLAYNELYLGVTSHFPLSQLSAIVASHADPDIIASLDRWMTSTSSATLYISKIWDRFAPHFCKRGKTDGRIVGIPDQGMRIPLGTSELIALPAHFLHAEGNFQFYDPISKILFSGDLGASFGAGLDMRAPITSLMPHLPRMEAFHRRYMVSNKVLRYWARMVKPLDIRLMVPQHGAPLAGAAIGEFIDWVQTLACGVDLMNEQHYSLPAR
ncbi:MBL fold metallo-hydrolase [Derxia gummosa]|uniref:MBL fold metallo-hydrolase n=1 Tax=Derxia gummosa DSM 723 TaxID=1121388 RepID=A0A8B6X7J5_9BURK|nr:MBL fold metallo-hydrolase [Derxia gummosa]